MGAEAGRDASPHAGVPAQSLGELGQDIRQRFCSESQLQNTVGLLTGFAVGLVLVALLLAAPVIAALIPAVVQFCPQTCKHWENIT